MHYSAQLSQLQLPLQRGQEIPQFSSEIRDPPSLTPSSCTPIDGQNYAILISSSVLKDETDRTAHTAKLSKFGKGTARIKYKYSSTSQFAHRHCAFSFSGQRLMGTTGSLTKPPSSTFGMTLPWLLLSPITSRTYHTRPAHSRRQPSRFVTAVEIRSCARLSAWVPPRLR